MIPDRYVAIEIYAQISNFVHWVDSQLPLCYMTHINLTIILNRKF